MKKYIILCAFIIIACKPSSNSILSISNCELPCWNGIVVGKTNEDELLVTLNDISTINQSSIKHNKQTQGLFNNRISFSFQENWSLSRNSMLNGYAYLKDNTVIMLLLCGEINTAVNKLVEVFGEPQYIISGNSLDGGRTVILIDSENGVSYSFTTELSKLEIVSTTELDCVNLFALPFYEAILDAGYFSDGYYNAEETRKVWYEWDGYGNLDEKYPPRQP